MTYRIRTLFCGAGGDAAGAELVPGVEVVHAMNHWDKAIQVHASNHPDAEHTCADISQYEPRRLAPTEILWASPECTNHSQAKGRKRVLDGRQGDIFGETLPDEAAERSRATMWDVVRFAEAHRYLAIIVENVVDVVKWQPYNAWVMAMDSLGYDFQPVCLNSMHAQENGLPAPQSRDRWYGLFTRRDVRKVNVERLLSPPAYCPRCDEIVESRQAWKPGRAVGRYRQQYVYLHAACGTTVEPGWLPASAAIDWTIKGQRIGERAKPLADKTRRRIAAGIARYWSPVHLEAAGHTYDAADPKHASFGDPNAYYRAWSTDDVLKTLHTIESKALAVPAGGTWNDDARPTSDPRRTMTTREAAALVTPYYGASQTARPTSDALGTLTTVDRYALITRHNGSKGDGGEMTTPIHEALRTLTTTAQQSVITPGDLAAAEAQVDDCLFRMLEPHEVAAGMAFPSDYRWEGTRRERVRMAGNAVTPPAARDLISAVVDAIEGTAA